jgi:hypothetical protein
MTHPELEIEQDVRELMALHEELASLLLQDSADAAATSGYGTSRTSQDVRRESAK